MDAMAFPNRDPLADTERVLIDGNNVLHRIARTAGSAPPAALVGRLRSRIPAGIAIELVFDGPPEGHLRGERVAAGTTVRYGGARSADAVILDSVEAVRRDGGPAATARLLVVTDDHDLRHGVRRRGGRTAGVAWLLGRLEVGAPTTASLANARPPRIRPAGELPGANDGASSDDDPERPGWRPGRGATTKRGNPKRAPRPGRAGRMRP